MECRATLEYLPEYKFIRCLVWMEFHPLYIVQKSAYKQIVRSMQWIGYFCSCCSFFSGIPLLCWRRISESYLFVFFQKCPSVSLFIHSFAYCKSFLFLLNVLLFCYYVIFTRSVLQSLFLSCSSKFPDHFPVERVHLLFPVFSCKGDGMGIQFVRSFPHR